MQQNLDVSRLDYFIRNFFLNYRFKGRAEKVEKNCNDKKYIISLYWGEKRLSIHICKTARLLSPQNFVIDGSTISCLYDIDYGTAPLSKVENHASTLYSIDIQSILIRINIVDEIFNRLSLYDEIKGNGRINDSGQPIVDKYYRLLASAINRFFKTSGIDNRVTRRLPSFNICLTHDVDALKKTPVTILRYGAIQSKGLHKGAGNIFRYLRGDGSLNHIDDIKRLEETFSARSTFFVYAKRPYRKMYKAFLKKLIDPDYDLSELSPDMEIETGLHGSYFAATDFELLQEEYTKLTAWRGNREIISYRNHFLNFSLEDTPLFLERVGIRCDTSVYYNERPGFGRIETASPFYMYSHKEGRILNLIQIPTVLMDSTLFNHLRLDPETAYERSIEILDIVKEAGGIVCINWHNETYNPSYGWYDTYRAILDWINANGGLMYTISEIYKELTWD